MSTLEQQVEELLAMANAVGWEIRHGSKHKHIMAPGRARPITLPGTPSTARSVANPAAVLKRAGLNEAYARHLADKKENRGVRMARAVTANQKKLEAVEAANGQNMAAVLKENNMQIGYEQITPQQAQALLDATEAAQDFSQRPVRWHLVNLYREQMEAGEWQQYMPDGVICIDPAGMLINGQKRMHALVQSGKTLGFVVARNVPRRLFPYFDMAQPRSAADTFAVAGLPSGPDMQSAVRLAMSYEAMIREEIPRVTWASWNKTRIPNPDAFAFYSRRPELAVPRELGRAVQARSGVLTAAVITFYFYADKAWPTRPRVTVEGYKGPVDPLDAYLWRIRDGEHMGRTDPEFLIREWAGSLGGKVPAKRELMLYVLLRYWNELNNPTRKKVVTRIAYSPNWPMPYPYNPDGENAALDNLLKP